MRNKISELSSINAVGSFSTGEAVTITVYDMSDSSVVALNSNVCSEIATTGKYKWNFSNITTPPTSIKQYLYIMTNGVSTISEVEVFGGWTESIVGATIPADTCKITVNIFNPNDSIVDQNDYYNEIYKSTAKIKDSFYDSDSIKNFSVKEYAPRGADLNGEIFWIFPQGATVQFEIPLINLTKEVVIPATATANLNDIAAV